MQPGFLQDLLHNSVDLPLSLSLYRFISGAHYLVQVLTFNFITKLLETKALPSLDIFLCTEITISIVQSCKFVLLKHPVCFVCNSLWNSASKPFKMEVTRVNLSKFFKYFEHPWSNSVTNKTCCFVIQK